MLQDLLSGQGDDCANKFGNDERGCSDEPHCRWTSESNSCGWSPETKARFLVMMCGEVARWPDEMRRGALEDLKRKLGTTPELEQKLASIAPDDELAWRIACYELLRPLMLPALQLDPNTREGHEMSMAIAHAEREYEDTTMTAAERRRARKLKQEWRDNETTVWPGLAVISFAGIANAMYSLLILALIGMDGAFHSGGGQLVNWSRLLPAMVPFVLANLFTQTIYFSLTQTMTNILSWASKFFKSRPSPPTGVPDCSTHQDSSSCSSDTSGQCQWTDSTKDASAECMWTTDTKAEMIVASCERLSSMPGHLVSKMLHTLVDKLGDTVMDELRQKINGLDSPMTTDLERRVACYEITRSVFLASMEANGTLTAEIVRALDRAEQKIMAPFEKEQVNMSHLRKEWREVPKWSKLTGLLVGTIPMMFVTILVGVFSMNYAPELLPNYDVENQTAAAIGATFLANLVGYKLAYEGGGLVYLAGQKLGQFGKWLLGWNRNENKTRK